MNRPRPDEEAVRQQLRDQREELKDAARDRAASNGAEGEAEAGQPEAGQPQAGQPEAGQPQAGQPEAGQPEAAEPQAAEPQAAEPQTAEPEPAESQDPTAALRRERDEYLDLAKRTQADFENYRKRSAKDISAAGSRARVGLIREVLPVVDNLERALASATDADTGLAEGVRLVLSELNGVLQRAGVSVIEPGGETFDPTVHEALSTRSEDGAEAGRVLDVVEKGYRTDDFVIRPARVIVAA